MILTLVQIIRHESHKGFRKFSEITGLIRLHFVSYCWVGFHCFTLHYGLSNLGRMKSHVLMKINSS